MGDCLLRRRKKDNIPYTTVDYIQFDGTSDSVFDTGISQSSSPGEEIEVTFDIGGATNQGVFQISGWKTRLHLCTETVNKATIYETSKGSSNINFDKNYYGKHTFIGNKNSKLYFDDEEISNFTAQSSTTNHYKVGVYYDNSTHKYLSGKIYEWKIKKNTSNEYLQWLVPVQYNDSGAVKYGFYDKVSGTLIANEHWTGGYDA